MGSGDPFIEGVADIRLAQISAGGTTVILVSIIDDQGALFTEAVDVIFSSGCSSLTTPSAEISSPITTLNGTATSTYLAKGCTDKDPSMLLPMPVVLTYQQQHRSMYYLLRLEV